MNGSISVSLGYANIVTWSMSVLSNVDAFTIDSVQNEIYDYRCIK